MQINLIPTKNANEINSQNLVNYRGNSLSSHSKRMIVIDREIRLLSKKILKKKAAEQSSKERSQGTLRLGSIFKGLFLGSALATTGRLLRNLENFPGDSSLGCFKNENYPLNQTTPFAHSTTAGCDSHPTSCQWVTKNTSNPWTNPTSQNFCLDEQNVDSNLNQTVYLLNQTTLRPNSTTAGCASNPTSCQLVTTNTSEQNFCLDEQNVDSNLNQTVHLSNQTTPFTHSTTAGCASNPTSCQLVNILQESYPYVPNIGSEQHVYRNLNQKVDSFNQTTPLTKNTKKPLNGSNQENRNRIKTVTKNILIAITIPIFSIFLRNFLEKKLKTPQRPEKEGKKMHIPKEIKTKLLSRQISVG